MIIGESRPESSFLVLATSFAPELRSPALRPRVYPRTDYVELARLVDCDILDYALYDTGVCRRTWRSLERRLRLDFHLALSGYRRARRYGAVLLMSERVAIPFMMLQRAFGRRSATVFVSAHSSSKQARLVKSMGIFSGLDIAVSNTHAQKQFLVEEMGIPESRIRYVLYAADERFFTPEGQPTDYVFSAGGIAGRDYPTLFQAVTGLPVQVKIAASGRAYGPGAWRNLPSIPPNVKMLSPMDYTGMRDTYRRCSLVVVPLSGERRDAAGCSIVLEGMCCGKTVIASRTRGMEDYIRSGRTGLLVPPGDPGEMRTAILRAFDDSQTESADLGGAARAECEGRLSMDSLVGGLADAAREAAGCPACVA